MLSEHRVQTPRPCGSEGAAFERSEAAGDAVGAHPEPWLLVSPTILAAAEEYFCSVCQMLNAPLTSTRAPSYWHAAFDWKSFDRWGAAHGWKLLEDAMLVQLRIHLPAGVGSVEVIFAWLRHSRFKQLMRLHHAVLGHIMIKLLDAQTGQESGRWATLDGPAHTASVLPAVCSRSKGGIHALVGTFEMGRGAAEAVESRMASGLTQWEDHIVSSARSAALSLTAPCTRRVPALSPRK